ncbi:hypothetical protein AVEN_139056-1 [Araneus ventricosus]|uniref:Uncharacterized protein n=1 Tax=Araneus ventricosus TaxID=182803 RepID=A0A4Y2QL42_ARAVE|nr:hypothetical protein AVEN_139056-1 [Araneus ventricosus]
MHNVWPPNRHNKRQPRVMYHDTTSGFYGKGKLQAVQLFNRKAAHQYCRRTFHQVQTWQVECLNPSNWGWKLVNKSLTLIYTIKGPKPAKIESPITYGCNKGCGKSAKVSELRYVAILSAKTVEAKAASIPKQ